VISNIQFPSVTGRMSHVARSRYYLHVPFANWRLLRYENLCDSIISWKFVFNPARAKHPYLVGHILVLTSRLASRLVSLEGRGHMRLGSGRNHSEAAEVRSRCGVSMCVHGPHADAVEYN
jgi:hypothetical protein